MARLKHLHARPRPQPDRQRRPSPGVRRPGAGPQPLLRRHPRAEEHRPGHPPGRVRGPARAAAAAASRPCCAAWPASTPRPPARWGSTARTSVAFQEPRLLPWKRVRDNVALDAAERPGRGAPLRARRRRRSPRSAWATSSTPGRCSSPAARPSGSRWPGPWSATRPDAARRAVQRAGRADPHRDAPAGDRPVARATPWPSCSSPTTSTRRSPSPTGSWSWTRAASRTAGRSPSPAPTGPRRNPRSPRARAEILEALGVQPTSAQPEAPNPWTTKEQHEHPAHHPHPRPSWPIHVPRRRGRSRRRRPAPRPAAAAPPPATRTP